MNKISFYSLNLPVWVYTDKNRQISEKGDFSFERINIYKCGQSEGVRKALL